MAKAKKGYVNNERFLELLKERQAIIASPEFCQEDRHFTKIDREIGKIFLSISEGMMRRPNFINYPPQQKVDMTSDAVYNMLRAADNYDTARTNPFAYFSQITFNAFLQSIQGMKKNISKFVVVEFLDNFDTFDNDMTGSDD